MTVAIGHPNLDVVKLGASQPASSGWSTATTVVYAQKPTPRTIAAAGVRQPGIVQFGKLRLLCATCSNFGSPPLYIGATKELVMGLMDILQQYTNSAATPNPNVAHEHYDEVARAAPPDILGQGVADAFRADKTPPFGEMVGQMFGQSNPQQQAGVVNELLRSVGPGVLSAIGGGILGRMSAPANTAAAQVTPQEASQLTPDQVQQIATQAEQHDPSVLDKVGGFYAQHPQIVKTLGSAALAIALAGVANRMRS